MCAYTYVKLHITIYIVKQKSEKRDQRIEILVQADYNNASINRKTAQESQNLF